MTSFENSSVPLPEFCPSCGANLEQDELPQISHFSYKVMDDEGFGGFSHNGVMVIPYGYHLDNLIEEPMLGSTSLFEFPIQCLECCTMLYDNEGVAVYDFGVASGIVRPTIDTIIALGEE